MTTGGKMSFIERLEAFAKDGHFGMKTRAWMKDVEKLKKDGITVKHIATFKEGLISCYIDWSECSVDVEAYIKAPMEIPLNRGNRLWLMAYKAQNPECEIKI